jgi:hypothetical protein
METFAEADPPVELVYVITTDPWFNPKTNPDGETVAIEVFELTQGFSAIGFSEPTNCEVKPEQIVKFPEIVGIIN